MIWATSAGFRIFAFGPAGIAVQGAVSVVRTCSSPLALPLLSGVFFADRRHERKMMLALQIWKLFSDGCVLVLSEMGQCRWILGRHAGIMTDVKADCGHFEADCEHDTPLVYVSGR
jgi:hypothetical protein